MGGKVFAIILVVILLGVGLYLITSGLITKGITSLNSLIASSSVGGSFHFTLAPSSSSSFPNFNLSPATSQQTTISAPAGTNANPNITAANVPAGYTLSQLSPYFHEVRLGSVSAGTSYYYGTITLDAYLPNATGSIDITGWQIKSRVSGEYIPQAIDVYDPSGLAPASDIRVHNNDVVSLYSSSAPFNLRLNECIGYVAHVADFVPALPLYCPYVDQSQIQNLSGQCQNYIESIGACQAPNMSSPQISQSDYACQDYLNNNFTYKSCFTNHDQDPNFLSNQVWVWMGSNVIDSYHDTVSLLDRNGLLVDQYTY